MRRLASLLRLPCSALLVVACASAASGCSDDETADATGGPPAEQKESPVQARFDIDTAVVPAFLDVPFPTDLYLGTDGRIADVPGLDAFLPKSSSYMVTALVQGGGYGTIGGAMFRVDDVASGERVAAAIDAGSLPRSEEASVGPDATAMLVDLEATDAASALVPARADISDDSELGSRTPPVITVYPARGIVLAPRHRYAAVLTSGIKTSDGRSVGPSATFRAVRDGVRRSNDAEKRYGDAVDTVATLVPALADRSAISALAVYTTGNASEELALIRAELAKAEPPPLWWDAASLAPMGVGLFAPEPLPAGFVTTLDAWLGTPGDLDDATDDPADDQTTGKGHDALAAVGTAVFNAPNLLIESAEGYDDPTHATFARDAGGQAIVNPDRPTAKIWMTIALPKGPVPAGGFPTVIVQHGLGGDRRFILAIANTFAKRGWASVAIETVTFGARAASATLTVDEHAGFAWSTEAESYDGPDGFVDDGNGAVDFFGSLKNLGALRDQMRQSVLDIGTARDVVSNPALDLGPLLLAVPGARLDATRLAYLGDSLGALMGSIVAAIEPRIQTLVLNVGGGGIPMELANGPYIASQIDLAASFNFGVSVDRFSPAHPIVQLMQHAVEAADPLAYARHIVNEPLSVGGTESPAKSLILIEALWDETVSNEATEALARAAGLPLGEPSGGSLTGVPLLSVQPEGGAISNAPKAGVTAVLVQASPATHGGDLFRRFGQHKYAHPFAHFDEDPPFTTLATPFTIEQPYLPLQAMMVDFLESAFAGGGAPVVKGFPAPRLDFDADGAPDDADADPNDPAKQ